MSEIQLFAIEEAGPRPVPVPDHVSGFDGLYDGLPLGVYSALRTFNHNQFLYLHRHLARTVNSMRLLGWDYILDEERLRQALHTVCTAYPLPEARVRFDVLAAPATARGTDSRELVALIPFTPVPSILYEQGVRVGLARDLHRARPLAKTADFALQRQAYKIGGAIYEYILLDEADRLLEGTGTNFYGVCDGVLVTAGEGVLAGITREIILELAPQVGIPVRREAIKLADVPTLQEAAISGSSRGLLPVIQIENQTIGDGRVGPICRRLGAAYDAFVAAAIQPAIKANA